MNISAGDFVFYIGTGVCRVEGIEKRCFDGASEREYYKLSPLDAENSVCYVPQDRIGERTRPLVTAEEAYRAMDSVSGMQSVWSNDNMSRRALFRDMIHSGDFESLLLMIKSIEAERRSKKTHGKQLSLADENMLRSAESVLEGELSAVLGIERERVKALVMERIEG